jgi:hypothetical protein
MKLYNAWYCPFAQRVWMALVHKGINFEYVEVDPYDKIAWLSITIPTARTKGRPTLPGQIKFSCQLEAPLPGRCAQEKV